MYGETWINKYRITDLSRRIKQRIEGSISRLVSASDSMNVYFKPPDSCERSHAVSEAA